MNLNARLARLEATHKRILRCLWCRYSLRTITLKRSGGEVKTDDYLWVKCWSCGTPYVMSLKGRTARQREIYKLIQTSHPTKLFNDERVHTAQIWLSLSSSQVKGWRASKRQIMDLRRGKKPPASSGQLAPWQKTAEQRKQEREQESIKTQATAFDMRRNEEWKRQAKGPDSFPIDKVLDEIKSRYDLSNYGEAMKEYVRASGLADEDGAYSYSDAISEFKRAAVACHQRLSALKRREACEVLLWGAVEPNTLEEIAFFEARIEYLPDIARRALAKEKEKQRLEAEKRRRENEEYMRRNRERSTLIATPAEVEPPVRSDAWASVGGDDDAAVIVDYDSETGNPKMSTSDFLRSQMPETAYNALMEAFHNQKQDGQAQRRIDIPYIPPANPPPNDGRDPFYHRRMAYYKVCGVWPDDTMLSR